MRSSQVFLSGLAYKLIFKKILNKYDVIKKPKIYQIQLFKKHFACITFYYFFESAFK